MPNLFSLGRCNKYLCQIWFDGGYTGTQRSNIQELLKRHQPQAVIFNGCQEDGTCVSENSGMNTELKRRKF